MSSSRTPANKNVYWNIRFRVARIKKSETMTTADNLKRSPREIKQIMIQEQIEMIEGNKYNTNQNYSGMIKLRAKNPKQKSTK